MIRVLGPRLIQSGLKAHQQTEIDDLLIKLDGSENKANLGANAILGISMAVARAGAAAKVSGGVVVFRHNCNTVLSMQYN